MDDSSHRFFMCSLISVAFVFFCVLICLFVCSFILQEMRHVICFPMACFKKFTGLSNHTPLGSWEIMLLKVDIQIFMSWW